MLFHIFEKHTPLKDFFLKEYDVVITFVLTDIIIFISYMIIPFFILLSTKKSYGGLQGLKPISRLFAAMMFCCGFGYLIQVFNVYLGYYHIHAIWNLITASISAYTCYEVYKIIQFLKEH